MNPTLFIAPEKFRVQPAGYESQAGDTWGSFFIPARDAHGRSLRILADGGELTGWEHVSVSVEGDKRGTRTYVPNYLEMSLVKNLFWAPEACVVEFHPPKADHINLHSGVLHLWRWRGGQFPMPPKILV